MKCMLNSWMISSLNYTFSCCCLTFISPWEMEESSIFLPNFSLTQLQLSDSVAFWGNILLSGHPCYSAVAMETGVPKRKKSRTGVFAPSKTQHQVPNHLLHFPSLPDNCLLPTIYFSLELVQFSSQFSTIFKGIKIDYILSLSFQLPFVTVVENISTKATSIKWETL